jgi:hypothetical protein
MLHHVTSVPPFLALGRRTRENANQTVYCREKASRFGLCPFAVLPRHLRENARHIHSCNTEEKKSGRERTLLLSEPQPRAPSGRTRERLLSTSAIGVDRVWPVP